MSDLSGRVALISGAGRGLEALSRAAMEELAADNIHVELVTYRKSEMQARVEIVIGIVGSVD